ncbi:unnamed protein product [Kuraishia capsulata CBS 1993]|uniref:Ubiquitin-like protease family profile domain-containing protein n=1 Tax=Kuraishia capsulata CBS 1993 TaxID=1382522 RepID=W6MFZ4_9ASCO|nr:uncharacterized protein KUCA_T00000856001 [Kuraishia capsulata CBS 1993]CDK24889.1 unnamed protein product [Kuraishia capsulata CBS 1993]
MLRTVFSAYKGYHAPKDASSQDDDNWNMTQTRSRTRSSRRQLGPPLSGFDQLKWDVVGKGHSIVYGDSKPTKKGPSSSDSDISDDDRTPDGNPKENTEGSRFYSEDQIPYDEFDGNFSYASPDILEPDQDIEFEASRGDNEKKERIGKNGKNNKTRGTGKHRKQDRVMSRKLERKARKEEKKQKKSLKSSGLYATSDGDKVKLLNELYREASSRLESSFKYYDVSVYKEDLFNLTDDQWLNDNNLSFIYEFLTRFQLVPILSSLFNKSIPLEKSSESIILLKPSMSYLLMHTRDPTMLKGVLPPMERASFVFLPVNDNDDVELAEGGSHWSLVVASIPDNTCFVFDSMTLANESESLTLINRFEAYMGQKYKVRANMPTPQQINGSDCGIMVLQTTALLLARLLNSEEGEPLSFDLSEINLSAIDGRIFVLGTILNLLRSTSG